MTIQIGIFLLIGGLFGLLSYSNRHLFSEGPTAARSRPDGLNWAAWLFWVSMCTLLWPIMVLTGLNTAWVLAKRRKRALDSSKPA